MTWKTTRDGMGILTIAGAIALLTCGPTYPAPGDTSPPEKPDTRGTVPAVVLDAQGASSKGGVGVPAVLVVPAGENVEAVMSIAAAEIQQYLSGPTLVYRLALVGACANLDCKPCQPPDPNHPNDPDCSNFPPPPPVPEIGSLQDGYLFMRAH